MGRAQQLNAVPVVMGQRSERYIAFDAPLVVVPGSKQALCLHDPVKSGNNCAVGFISEPAGVDVSDGALCVSDADSFSHDRLPERAGIVSRDLGSRNRFCGTILYCLGDGTPVPEEVDRLTAWAVYL